VSDDDEDMSDFQPAARRLVHGWFWWGLLALGLFIVASAIAGCRPLPPVQPPTIPDGAAPATCEDACWHIDADLGCQYGGGCLSICHKVRSQSFKDCLLAATSCEQVDVCDQ
jgi:hypothetical protein